MKTYTINQNLKNGYYLVQDPDSGDEVLARLDNRVLEAGDAIEAIHVIECGDAPPTLITEDYHKNGVYHSNQHPVDGSAIAEEMYKKKEEEFQASQKP